MWLPGWILYLRRRNRLQSVLIVSEAPFLNVSEHHHSFKVYIAHFKTVSNFLPMHVHTTLPLRDSQESIVPPSVQQPQNIVDSLQRGQHYFQNAYQRWSFEYRFPYV